MAESPFHISSDEHRIDPDPWIVIQTAISLVGVVGVFIQIALSQQARRGTLQGQRTTVEDNLAKAIRDAVEAVEALHRFLAKADIQPADTLERKFRYAETTMLIEFSDFGRFERIFRELVASLSFTHDLTMQIVRYNPDRAKALGLELHRDIGDFAKRLNAFFDGEMTNSAVISECLVMLRTFDRVLARLDHHRN